MKTSCFFVLISIAILCPGQNINAQTPVSKASGAAVGNGNFSGRVDRLFRDCCKKGMPGVSISIIRNGDPVYSKGYGYASIEYGVPISANTRFHVASISKQFTAFAIATLIDKGKLSLNDPISIYVPDLPAYGSKITIRSLIHHTSGLKDLWNLIALAGWQSGDIVTDEQVMKLIKSQTSLNFEPGEEFLYSNTNYVLLAKIIERVSGEPFPQWAQKNIFKPLGMLNTFFNNDYARIIHNKAYSYQKHQGEFKRSILNSNIVGASGLITTAADLAKWAENFASHKLGGKVVMSLMDSAGSLSNGKSIPYAFGQVKTQYRGLNLWYHDGADAGYRTYFARFPEQKFAVTVLANTDVIDPKEVAMKIVDLYLPVDSTSSRGKSESTVKDNGTQLMPIDTVNFGDYIGRYELSRKLVFHVRNEENSLKGQFTGKKDVHELKPRSNSEFEMPTLNASVVFQRDSSGIVSQVKIQLGNSDEVFTAKKIEIFNPASVNLQQYEGKYYSPELSTAYQLTVKDGKIVARHLRTPDIELVLTEPDFFTGAQWFFKDVEVIRHPNRVISGIKISSSRARSVLFNKVDW